MVERKSFTQTWKRVDRTKGEYRPFGKLVQDFGGWSCQEAIDGACTATSKCIMMGAPWVVVHPQSGMTEYLVLQMGFEEEFSSMWSKFSETWQGDIAGSGSIRAELPAPSVVNNAPAGVAGGAGAPEGLAKVAAASTGKGAKGSSKGACAAAKKTGLGGGGAPSPGKLNKA